MHKVLPTGRQRAHPTTTHASISAEPRMKQRAKNMSTEKYQAPRTAVLRLNQDKLRPTAGGHTHRQNTRNVSRSGRAKCWPQLGTKHTGAARRLRGASSILPGTNPCNCNLCFSPFVRPCMYVSRE